ncbi:hypothetical protein CBA19CS91_26685 [Paraburkholderia hospita]|nr:hypothetical protein CBA19CS91_26685 [Paraburkholderia hospita]
MLYKIETQRLFWYARQHRPADLRLDVGRVFNVYIGFLQLLASFRLCPAAKERTPRCFAAGTALIRQAISASRESTPESRLTLARFSFGESSSANRSGLRTTQAVHCRMSNVGVELSP